MYVTFEKYKLTFGKKLSFPVVPTALPIKNENSREELATLMKIVGIIYLQSQDIQTPQELVWSKTPNVSYHKFPGKRREKLF